MVVPVLAGGRHTSCAAPASDHLFCRDDLTLGQKLDVCFFYFFLICFFLSSQHHHTFLEISSLWTFRRVDFWTILYFIIFYILFFIFYIFTIFDPPSERFLFFFNPNKGLFLCSLICCLAPEFGSVTVKTITTVELGLHYQSFNVLECYRQNKHLYSII